MNIAIVGYGKMGHIIEKIALDKGIDVISKIDPNAEDATHKEINEESLKDVEVCIEFTAPTIAVGNIKKIASLKKNIVVGTTAWYDKLDEVRKAVEDNDIGFIYSPNFSIGVNVFFRLIEQVSKILDNIDEYSLSMSEAHHIHKKDAPSGTAKMIAELIEENTDRFKGINIKSIREGEIPGTHTVNFESNADIINLEHQAKNREGFALGSVLAAEWINGKKGFYTIDDFMKGIIK
ncbi:MAG: 4-hydroxy-tetrahydrodipicolinate reductase [Nanoarchaeota archaeon]|nr:4-hydroxy-tetrahydrodipicolinate reductase [Nanoarchaeota archaeon]